MNLVLRLTRFSTACPLKTRKILLSAYKLSASGTEPFNNA
jgi:hypothetical protein